MKKILKSPHYDVNAEHFDNVIDNIIYLPLPIVNPRYVISSDKIMFTYKEKQTLFMLYVCIFLQYICLFILDILGYFVFFALFLCIPSFQIKLFNPFPLPGI